MFRFPHPSKSLRCLAVASLALFAANAHAAWDSTATHAIPLDSSIATSPLAGSTPLHLGVDLQLRNQDQLKAAIKNLYTPGNPQYGMYLTPAQFTAQYGPTADQVSSVMSYLAQMGFTNLSVTPNNALVTGDGTAAMAAKAFNTTLVQFTQNGKTVYMPGADVMMPSSLNGVVLGVTGLRTAFPMTTNSMQLHQDAKPSPAVSAAIAKAARGRPQPAAFDPTTAFLNMTFLPAAFVKAYDAESTPDGSATVVAISTGGTDLSGPLADIRAFERFAGLPFVPISVVQTAPVPATQTPDNDGEWDLDVQYSTGIAGNVKGVIFYNGAGIGDLGSLQGFANDNKAKLLNMSFGGCETVDEAAGDIAMDDMAFMQMVMQGQTAFASSGDAGASCSVAANLGTPDSGPTDVEYPGSSTYVVSVGGTSLFTDATYDYNGEIAWPSGGGGTSVFETSSTFQAASGVETASSAPTNLRAVPDVSMNAGFNIGPAAGFYETADVIDNGYHEYTVGTSLSSPLSMGSWARFQSAHCESFGFAIPLIYALDTAGGLMSTATGFNDITEGTNGVYVAGTGFDYTNGFGSYDIGLVNSALPAAPTTCTADTPPVAVLSPSVTSGPAPLAVTFDASASNDPDGNGIAYYVMDFGDGNDVTFQDNTFSQPSVFPSHSYASPGVYIATLQVRDGRGAVSKSVSQAINVTGIPAVCNLPGVTIMTSPPGVSPGEEGMDTGNGIDDLLSVSVAEPGDMPNKLVFTIVVNNLTTVTPNFRWVVYFRLPNDTLRDTDLYYVAMVSADGATPVFNYGIKTIEPGAGLAVYNVLGTLDAASNYTPAGVITLVLDKSATGIGTSGIHTGDLLTYIEANTRISVADSPSGTTPLGSGTTQDDAGDRLPYLVLGNDICAAGVTATTTLGSTSGSSTGGSSGGASTGGSSGGSSGGTSTGGTSGGSTTGGSSTGGIAGASSTGGTTSTGSGNYHGFFGGSFGEAIIPLALLAGLRRRNKKRLLS